MFNFKQVAGPPPAKQNDSHGLFEQGSQKKDTGHSGKMARAGLILKGLKKATSGKG